MAKKIQLYGKRSVKGDRPSVWKGGSRRKRPALVYRGEPGPTQKEVLRWWVNRSMTYYIRRNPTFWWQVEKVKTYSWTPDRVLFKVCAFHARRRHTKGSIQFWWLPPYEFVKKFTFLYTKETNPKNKSKRPCVWGSIPILYRDDKEILEQRRQELRIKRANRRKAKGENSGK